MFNIIQYISLSPFLEEEIIQTIQKQHLKEHYFYVKELNYIDISEDESHLLEKKFFKKQRAELLYFNSKFFSSEQKEKIEKEFYDYQNLLLTKYLSNINYQSFEFDFRLAKIFYTKE